MSEPCCSAFVDRLVAYGGETGALIARRDWTRTTLGPIEAWPQSLKTTTEFMLRSAVPLVMLWGEDGVMLYNDAYSVFAGGRHPDLLGSKVREGWAEVADFNDNVMKVGLAGGTLSYKDQELTLYRNGQPEQVWMNLDYSPVPGDDGRPAGVMAIVVETTERVRTERREAFRLELKAHLRELSDPEAVMGAAVEALGVHLDANRVGYSEIRQDDDAAIILACYANGVAPLSGKHALSAFGRESNARQSYGRVEVCDDVAADPAQIGGIWPSIETRAFVSVPLVRNGRITASFFVNFKDPHPWTDDEVALIEDVAVRTWEALERARAEATARRALLEPAATASALNATLEARVAEALAEQRLLADIVDGADIFVQVADLDFNWLAINDSSAREFSRIFGVRRPQAGDNMLALLEGYPEHQAAVRSVWSRALAGEEFVEIQAFGDKAHDRRHYEMRFRTLKDAQGQVIGAYQFVSDVTERLNEQRRLMEAEAALAQAQKMDAIGQLTGGIVHDFNNLLGAVVGSFDLIRRRPADTDRVRRCADAGLQAAERGAKLTGQLLAFSRAQRLEIKPVIVSAVVEQMRDLLDRTLGPMIRLKVELEGDGAALSDPTQLEMAILNLAINARDAMPDGGDLTIRTGSRRIDKDVELEPGDYVELAVQDTGSGMPPEVVARAFDPFFTTKGVGKGTGLGLSQVYGIARQAGGAVRIDSRPGEGTTVYIYLRKTNAPPEEKARDDVSEVSERRGSARVLIVDDDSDLRRVLAASLEALGYEVLEASNGPMGLELAETAGPDLMMVDFALPGMNGAQVAQAARERWPNLPIIFASGYSDTDAIERAAIDAPVLRKPFRVDQLQGALALALGR